MNTLQRLTPVTLIAALLAALVLVQADAVVAAPAQQVLRLPDVHVVAQRSPLQPMKVVQLPAVEIVVKRDPRPGTQLAARSARASAL